MTSKYLAYKGIQLHYTDEGKGRVLVFLHGFLENLEMWNELKDELTRKYRVICIDLLGHGQTPCLSYVHSMNDMAETVKAVLNHLKIRRYVVFGHSMGGYVALALAELYPKNIIGIGLINSTPASDSKEKKQNRDRAILAVKQHKKSFIASSIKQLFWEENHQKLKHEIEYVIKAAHQTSIQGIIAALEGMKVRNDLSHILETAVFKTLIIKGKHDSVIDQNYLSNICAHTYADCFELNGGHMSQLENYEDLSYIIKRYIEKL